VILFVVFPVSLGRIAAIASDRGLLLQRE